jgi:dienelactone hydrolase
MFGFLLAAQILISSPSDLLDQNITIEVENLLPSQKIELHAKAEDENGRLWSSWATFNADENGCVLPEKMAPAAGSYQGVDGMGLFWSMAADSHSAFKCKEDCFTVRIECISGEQLLAQETISRYLLAPNIQRIEVREMGLAGTLFLPPSEKQPPVIIVLGGSGGGISETKAKLLASNGFAAFALGYFGVPGLPETLENIRLEYFETSLEWLKTQPVDASKIGIYGVSRGGELALILGTLLPVQAIAAIAPSSVVYGGLAKTPTNAWLYQGKPISPFAPSGTTTFIGGKGISPSNPANSRAHFIKGMKEKKAFEAAAIPVEKIRCPALIISGGDDQLWPSEIFAKQILKRNKSFRHLNYPKAGHGISIPNLPQREPIYYHPGGKLWFTIGGSKAADQAASAHSWSELLSFFRKAFAQQTSKD